VLVTQVRLASKDSAYSHRPPMGIHDSFQCSNTQFAEGAADHVYSEQ